VQAGDEGAGASGSLHFDGDSDGTCETLNSGQGSGYLDGSISGTVNYSRTGNVVFVFGTGLTVDGSNEDHDLFAMCKFTPVPGNPVTSFELKCAATLGSNE
jgi:hypothetical protein